MCRPWRGWCFVVPEPVVLPFMTPVKRRLGANWRGRSVSTTDRAKRREPRPGALYPATWQGADRDTPAHGMRGTARPVPSRPVPSCQCGRVCSPPPVRVRVSCRRPLRAPFLCREGLSVVSPRRARGSCPFYFFQPRTQTGRRTPDAGGGALGDEKERKGERPLAEVTAGDGGGFEEARGAGAPPARTPGPKRKRAAPPPRNGSGPPRQPERGPRCREASRHPVVLRRTWIDDVCCRPQSIPEGDAEKREGCDAGCWRRRIKRRRE